MLGMNFPLLSCNVFSYDKRQKVKKLGERNAKKRNHTKESISPWKDQDRLCDVEE